jgi:photosystem II stability/assembly factor-like uncharacterized protein
VVFNGNIWTSDDTGVTWVEDMSVGSPQAWISIASSADGANLAAVVFSGSIWTSADSGATWVEDSCPGTSGLNWFSIASSADGAKLAAVVAFGGIWTLDASVPP